MLNDKKRIKLLFLCTGNSCRSQMAEGWARHLRGDALEVRSAGIEKHGMNPWAIKAMAEAGVDISGHQSNILEELDIQEFDYVVTVCSNAHESCPIFPGEAVVIHHGFDDPPGLTRDVEDEEEKMKVYRRVRDEIKAFVETLPQALKERN